MLSHGRSILKHPLGESTALPAYGTRIMVQLSSLVALGLILFLFEALLPHPLPWVKLGLSNIISLLTLYIFGLRATLVVVFSRVTLGSLILGTLLNPTFLFALCGGTASALVMGLVKQGFSNHLSVIGISILGALAHNLAQLFLAYLLFVKRVEILYLMPIMLFSSVISGFVIGLIAHFLLEIRKKS